ncbi:MAG: CaiB/BaiF CoA transferase family protein, partial [Fidelibacterota bacterium]
LSLSGIAGLTGVRNGPPVLPGVQIADLGGGALPAAVAILAAIVHRERKGEGQHIDMSITDGAISLLSIHAAEYLWTQKVPEKGETPLTGKYICYHYYKCKDEKYLAVGAIEPKFWQIVCQILNVPELESEFLAEGAERDELERKLENIFKTKNRDEWLKEFEGKDACVEPVVDLRELFEGSHVKSREMVVEVEHSEAGKIKQPGIPYKFSKTPAKIKWPAPPLGEHTEEILKNLGYTEDKISELIDKKVI